MDDYKQVIMGILIILNAFTIRNATRSNATLKVNLLQEVYTKLKIVGMNLEEVLFRKWFINDFVVSIYNMFSN